MGSVFNKETLPTKYTIDPPVGTPAAEEFATKAKRHPNRTFTPFQSSHTNAAAEPISQ
jgi:hypothetical protein